MIELIIAIVVALLIVKMLCWSPAGGSKIVRTKLSQDAALLRGIAGLFRSRNKSNSNIIPFDQ